MTCQGRVGGGVGREMEAGGAVGGLWGGFTGFLKGDSGLRASCRLSPPSELHKHEQPTVGNDCERLPE